MADPNFQAWEDDFYRHKGKPSLKDAWAAGREFGRSDTIPAPPAPTGQQAEPTDEQTPLDAAIQHCEAHGINLEFEVLDGIVTAALAGHQSERPAPAGQAVGECSLPPTGWRCTRNAGHEGPCAAIELPVTREWCAAHPGSAAHIIYLLAKQIDEAALAASQAERPSIKESSTTEGQP